MRTHLITTSLFLIATLVFGLTGWLIGEGLIARLLGIGSLLCGMGLIFAAFLVFAQALSMWIKSPDDEVPITGPTEHPAPTPKPTGTLPAHNAPAPLPRHRRAA